jgi:hypothetical protein
MVRATIHLRWQVDCEVAEWSAWAQCDAATGRKDRTRFIATRPSSDGNVCPALDDATDCAVQCEMGAWGPWGECSASCGGGKRTRRRAVEVPAKNGGKTCGSTEEADACNTTACVVQARAALCAGSYEADRIASVQQVDCEVAEWSAWAQCDAATGRKDRTRFIATRPSSDGNVCPAVHDATDCAVELHEAAQRGDLAAVKARPLLVAPSVTAVPRRDAVSAARARRRRSRQ